jgi:CHC2 zinc finger
MIADNVIAQLKANNPCDGVAARFGVRLRRRGAKLVGPCPICSRDIQGRSATRFEATADTWVCAVCADGGDVIRLVERAEGLDFKNAIAWLGGAGEVDPVHADRLARERQEKERRQKANAEAFRRRERGTLYSIWKAATVAAESPVANYMAARSLALPPNVRLRCVPDMRYFYGDAVGEDGRRQQRVIRRGAAMVAPIVGNDGHFLGLHFTWLDLSQPKGKAVIADPETGEVLPAKKVRGSKAGGHIELIPVPAPIRLIVGEGIETTLSVWTALSVVGRSLDGVGFWSAVDLGNLGGKATETVPHPAEVDGRGRPRRVPGPEPDLDTPAIALPDSVEDVVLLGDGDSDPFLTECALRRATSRWTTSRRSVRTAFAPSGHDFNDLLGASS